MDPIVKVILVCNLTRSIFNLLQHQNSGSHFVTLKALTLKSSGTYRCEVSAEAPFFSSAQKESRMEVVCKYEKKIFNFFAMIRL